MKNPRKRVFAGIFGEGARSDSNRGHSEPQSEYQNPLELVYLLVFFTISF